MAQTTVTATNCCLKTEAELALIAGGAYANIERRGDTYGTAMAIEDNSSGLMNEYVRIDKARPGDPNCSEVRVDVKYRKPVCGEGDDIEHDFTCTSETPTEDDYGYDSFTFQNSVSEKFTVREDLFDCRCEDPKEELAQILATKVRQMYQKYNRKLTERLAASVGSAFNGATSTAVDPKPLKLFVQNQLGQAVPQPMGLYDVVYEYQRQAPDSVVRPVIISGSKKVEAYNIAGELFRGNVDGQDGTKGALGGVYIDWQLPTVLAGSPASEPAISFLPNSIDIVSYNRFESANRRILADGRVQWAPVKASGTLVRQTIDIGTPILGREFIVDMQIQYEECTNQVTYTLRKDFDLWCMPQDAFCAGDLHNYKMLWDIVCAPYDCTDIC